MENPSLSKTQRNRARRLRQKARRKAAKAEGKVPKARSRKPRNRQQTGGGTFMPMCTEMYARALVNPFQPIPVPPCIPDTVSLPSHKFSARARGTFSTGTTGVGWVLMDPFLLSASDRELNTSDANDVSVLYTGATYPFSNVNIDVTDGTLNEGVFFANSNSIFTSAFLGDARRQYRLVSAGLSCRYIGTDFRNQGRICLYRQQGNVNIPGNNTVNASLILQDSYAVSVPVSRKTEYIYYIPDNPVLMGYQADSAYINVGHLSYLLFIDGGDTDTPQSWEFEAIAHYELIGPNVTLSKSNSDPTGLGAVLSSLATKAPTVPPKMAEASFFNEIYKNLVQGTTRTLGGVASAIPGMVAGAAYQSVQRRFAAGQQMSYPTIEDV